MKKTSFFIASAMGLTLLLYMAAYYLLPGDPPTAGMVGLFAALALGLVWAVSAWRGRSASAQKPSSGTTHKMVLWIALMTVAALGGCKAPPAPSPVHPSNNPPSPSRSSPSPSSNPASVDPLDRVTGTSLLLPDRKEPSGYGLYSYALLFHPPSDAELPRYKAFLKALVDLPAAKGLAQYVPAERINLTSIPLTQADPAWDEAEAKAKVDFILKHYDYARSAAIRASLSTKTGPGPVLLSVLHPVNPAEHPRPVLVQDMSRAQATLMSAYVQAFVSQAAQDRFWEESALSQFALGLRNSLETAAAGLNLSKSAVDDWVKFFK